jgi:hypothetical protein
MIVARTFHFVQNVQLRVIVIPFDQVKVRECRYLSFEKKFGERFFINQKIIDITVKIRKVK